MKLKIAAPDKVIYTWEVEKITVPTEWWELTILPWHQPLVSVVKNWIVTITPTDESQDRISIELYKGLLFVDGENIIITSSVALNSSENSSQVLDAMKSETVSKIDKIEKINSVKR